MRSDLIYIPDSELDALIQQDTPYLDPRFHIFTQIAGKRNHHQWPPE